MSLGANGLLALIFALLATFAAPAAAASPVLNVRLDWQAAVCGEASALRSRVLARTPDLRFVGSGEQVVASLNIQATGSVLVVHLSVRSGGRRVLDRTLRSSQCADALDAAALVLAISLEAQAEEVRAKREATADEARVAGARRPVSRPPAKREQPPAEPPSTPVEAKSEPAEPSEPGPAEFEPADVELADPAASQVVAGPAASLEAPEADAAVSPPVSGVPRPFGLTVSVEAIAQLMGGALPLPAPGVQVSAGLDWVRDSVWSPSIAVQFGHYGRLNIQRPEGQADFVLSTLGVRVCPLSLGTETLRFTPCATAELGRLDASGHDTFGPSISRRPWRAFGGSTRLVWRGEWLHAVSSFDATVPAIRDTFRFGPDHIFHRTAAVVWAVGVGAGVRWP